MAKNSTMTDSVKRSFKITRDKSFKKILSVLKGLLRLFLNLQYLN